MSLGGSSDSK